MMARQPDLAAGGGDGSWSEGEAVRGGDLGTKAGCVVGGGYRNGFGVEVAVALGGCSCGFGGHGVRVAHICGAVKVIFFSYQNCQKYTIVPN